MHMSEFVWIEFILFQEVWEWCIKEGSQWNMETWRFEFYLSRSRNSLEFDPKSEKTWTKHEI